MKKIMYCIMCAISFTYGANLNQSAPAEMVVMDYNWIEDNATDDATVYHEVKETPILEQNIQHGTQPGQMQEGQVDDSYIPQEVDLSALRDSDQIKVALLVPKKVIGAYANSVANSILTYLITKDTRFVFEVFDSGTQTPDALNLTMQKIKHKGYAFVIAAVTADGAQVLSKLVTDTLVFIPTVNHEDVSVQNPNIIYGGIDYATQIDALLPYADKKIVIFNDHSKLAQKITAIIKDRRIEDVVYEKEIKNMKANISYFFNRNRKLKKSSVFLNMPVVKSALIATQFSRYDDNISNILSTQVNYSPLLLTLTQYQDRKNFYIANSIGKIPFVLEDSNALLGSDITYNWITYATTVGLDYVFSNYFGSQNERIFDEGVFDRQIYYTVAVMQAMQGSFQKVDIPIPAEDLHTPSKW